MEDVSHNCYLDGSQQQQCENIKFFQNSDSDARVTDTLKKQVGVSIVPVAISLVLMLTSVVLHTYAYIRQKLHYLYLLSGCLFIFAGLASLTALIVFIAAVNGAVDNKQPAVKSKDDESPFVYNYGYSFIFAVGSFLMQEFNGICNIYWYVDYHRKYRFQASDNPVSKKFPVIPQVIKPSDIEDRVGQKTEIRIISDAEEVVGDSEPPPVQQIPTRYKPGVRKNKIVSRDGNFLAISAKNIDESSLTESSHHCSSSSTSHLTESSSSLTSEYQTKVNTLSNRQLDENELKFKFYKLDKEMLPPAPTQNPFRAPVSPPSNKIRIQLAKHEYKMKPSDRRILVNRGPPIRLNKPLLQKNKSLTDAYFYAQSPYELNTLLNDADYRHAVVVPNEHVCGVSMRPSRIDYVNHSASRHLLTQSPYNNMQMLGSKFDSPSKARVRVCAQKRRDFKRTTSV
ncbi:voltage-dependent calcium channel gamma-7 subunit-like [Brachionus plicatilis]|uniref:Voltage-dependent calcium channel gamma-7 subunit-like n=1 Tax=Brachionus plicatilis TaxID=10195 RepID=A0A3M7S6E9_BRAPC|nr:voltage-dependent calcium channel gamma-7 subunit-like [Brachionus plicatilis]